MGQPASSSCSVRSVSYDTIITSSCLSFGRFDVPHAPGSVTFRPWALTHLRTAGISSALPPLPSTTRGLIAPGPSHLTSPTSVLHTEDSIHSLSSFAQFPTKEVGHATITFSQVGFPARGDCLSNVHNKAIHCSVLPCIDQC